MTRLGSSLGPLGARSGLGPWSAWLVLSLAAAPVGCSFFLTNPSVKIVQVQLGSIGLLGATAQVSLDVTNPNDFDLRAEEIRYRLSFEESRGWHLLAEGEAEEEQVVPAGDTALVLLSLPFRYRDVGRAVGGLLSQGELRYRLEGDIKFDVPGPNLRVPFDRQGILIP